MKITIIGGDNRLLTVKNDLIAAGYSVDSLGLSDNDFGNISTSEAVILPVPTTKDKIHVYTPLTNRKITLKEVIEKTNENQLILSCNFSFENRKCVDYGALDSYALLNAVPTAEGAVKLAIENTDITLWKSKCLVIGYGRIGKVLANRLNAFGCDVTVTARKPSDLSLAETLGFSYINTEHLNCKKLDFDIIFNTVDAKIIKEEKMEELKNSVFIELSTFGGIDCEKAKKSKVKIIKAAGLPLKTAPKTAAKILSRTILHIINSYN